MGYEKGHQVSEETRKKISEKAKERFSNPEYLKKMSEAQKKTWTSSEHRKKMSEAQKKAWSNPELKKKQSESHKGQKSWNKGRIGLQVAWNKGKKGYLSLETLKKMSEAKKGKSSWMKGIHPSEETKRKQRETLIKTLSNPEMRKRLSEATKLGMANPEVRRKLRESHLGKIPWNKGLKGVTISGMKGKHQSEESKRKMSESRKKLYFEGKISPPMKGHRHTSEALLKMSNAHKGQIAWNKGKTGIYSEEVKRRISESTKKALSDPEVRKRMSESAKKALEKPELKKILSEIRKGKQSWMKGKIHTPEALLKMSLAHKGKHPDDETLRKRSESMKGKNKYQRTEEHIKKLREAHLGKIPWNKGISPSKETIEKQKATHKKTLSNLELRKIISDRISKANTGRHHTKEAKKKISDTWNKLEYLEIARERRAKQVFPFKDTKIEVKIQEFLKQLKLEFQTHTYIRIKHAYQCDLFIPSLNLVIECDGDRHHFNPKYFKADDKIYKDTAYRKSSTAEQKWTLDADRTRELQEKGYKVLRLWERDIKKMTLVEFRHRLTLFENI